MSETQRILVTGGTGFIGSYVVAQLREQGIEPVTPTLADLDLTDARMTDSVISSIRPEIVLHLGGVTGAGTTAERCNEVNFIGTVNLVQALERTGVSRVVLLGTAAEYGTQKTPFREDMPARPVSPYAVSKARANEFALERHTKAGFPVTILRVFTAYGYGQPGKMFLSQLLRSALLGQRFNMSDGLQRRDLVFVGDVANAIVLAATAAKSLGVVINIAGGRAITLKALATKLWDICGADPELLRLGEREKTGDDALDTEADITRAADLLGWRPEAPFIGDAGPGHPLYQMIDRMRDDLKAHDVSASASGLRAQ